MTIPDGYVRCRYTESGGEWTLSTFSMQDPPDVPVADMASNSLGTRPVWLLNVLAVATVAGQYHHVPNPPPYTILWFDLDANRNLQGFPHPPTPSQECSQ
jgi:hypothetical protein